MILVVDDERYIRTSLVGLLNDEGYQAVAAESAEKAEELIKSQSVELILLDIQMPGKDGLTFLEDNKERLEGIPVIIISGRGDIPTAVAAIKMGACDFIEKPLGAERVLQTVKQGLMLYQSLLSEQKLVGQLLEKYQIIGTSEAVTKLRELINKAALADAPVLINGENGTGKELVARQIHYFSNRKADPMITVNLPTIPETLFESELFGHVKGAYTGANKDRRGRFEIAGQGTIFLDEIGELPLNIQSKLLRILESGEYEKLGSGKTMTSECRVLAATNRNLKTMMNAGKFRDDLFYRLNVISIPVLPLRKRVEDIPALLDYFLEEIGAQDDFRFTAEAIGLMASYEWPGNVRHLKNFIHQVTFNCQPGEIGVDTVENVYYQGDFSGAEISEKDNRLTAAIHQFEIGFLSRLKQKHQGNISAMARELQMDRGNLSKKLKQLGIV